ncbi:MAG: hypothetical protein IJJ66_08775, partial [Treponema sp.]|nr:hypothetical protein [Treponema sp.]
ETTETKTNPADGEDYNIMKYSYLSYDNLMLSVTNTYLGSGAEMEIVIDGGDPVTADIANHVLSDDNFHTVSVSITKEHCTPVPVHEKKIYAKMKGITLTVGYIAMRHDGDDRADEVELDGKIYCNVTGDSQREYGFNGSKIKGKTHSITWNTSFTITSKDVSFAFWSDNMIDHDGGSGQDKMGWVSTSRSLADLRNNSYFDLSGSDADDDCSSWYHFTVGLSD